MPTIRVTSKPSTNVELVVSLCEYSRFGALSQAFVVEAIRKYAVAVRDAEPGTFDSSPMFNGAAWQGVAREIEERCEAFYAPDAVREEDDDERGDFVVVAYPGRGHQYEAGSFTTASKAYAGAKQVRAELGDDCADVMKRLPDGTLTTEF